MTLCNILKTKYCWAEESIKKDGLNRFSNNILKEIKYKATRYLYLNAGINYKIEKIQGSKMYLDLGDRGISRDLMRDKKREITSSEEVKKILKQNDIVLEVGANIGYYALMESKIVGKNGKIYACEPVEKNYDILNKNIKINNYENIETYKIALGAKNGKEKINISECSNLHSMSESFISDETTEVDVLTVDTFLKDKMTPTLIRMDVEGYEWEIVKGMEKTLMDKNLKNLYIEIHPSLMKHDDVMELLKTLKKRGFKISKMSLGTIPELIIDGITIDEILRKGMPKPHRVGAETFFIR